MDTPLNKAHFFARRSNQFSSDLKIQYLEKSILNFNLALNQTKNAKALESIQLQKDYYEKQLVLLNYKKTFKKSGKQKITKDGDDNEIADVDIINDKVKKSTDIQLDLFKNIEASDKLLEELMISVSDSSQMTELKNLNAQFNNLFQHLIECVDDTVSENELLKERLRSFEQPSKEDNAKQEYREIFPDSDSSPDDEELPALELPEFNLDSLGK